MTEVLVALLVIVIAVVPVAGVFLQAAEVHSVSEVRTTALHLARAEMEAAMENPVDKGPEPCPGYPDYTLSVRVSPLEGYRPDLGLKLVTVEVYGARCPEEKVVLVTVAE